MGIITRRWASIEIVTEDRLRKCMMMNRRRFNVKSFVFLKQFIVAPDENARFFNKAKT